MRHTFSVGVAVLSLSGCFYPAERGQMLEARVEKLTAENEALTARLGQSEESVKATLPKIDQKIAEVTAALESLDKASRRSSADIGVQVQTMVDDVARLRGEVETYVYKITELEAALKKLSEETEKRLAAAQGESAARAAEERRKAEELKRPTDKKEFLALADAKAKAGDLAVARQLYYEFMKKWPKDDLVANARFGLGEAYAKDDRCREALAEYGKVFENHPKSSVAPDALVRASDCFREVKMPAESRAALEEVVKSYPKSSAAKTAKQKLAELDKAKAPAKKKGK
jgi:tol-pal system protein YbgF